MSSWHWPHHSALLATPAHTTYLVCSGRFTLTLSECAKYCQGGRACRDLATHNIWWKKTRRHGERKTKTMYEKQFTAIEGPHSYIIALSIYFTLTVRSRDQNDGQFHTSTKLHLWTHTHNPHTLKQVDWRPDKLCADKTRISSSLDSLSEGCKWRWSRQHSLGTRPRPDFEPAPRLTAFGTRELHSCSYTSPFYWQKQFR